MKRGDIILANLQSTVGSEQGGYRPVLIIQNDVGNTYSHTIIVAALTAKLTKSQIPTHVLVHPDGSGLAHDSYVLLEQLRTIDKSRAGKKVGSLSDESMALVDEAIRISLGLKEGLCDGPSAKN